MILLECSNCGQTLNVDDAFAGGVCRCRHCGTIQTVPADAPRVDEAVAAAGGHAVEAAPVVAGSRPLYRREEQRNDAQSSGLDDLADAVLSSGMLSSGLSRGNRGPHKQKAKARPVGRNRAANAGPDRRVILLIALVALLVIVAGGLALALLGRDESEPADEPAALFGLPLEGSVAFVVDRGRASADAFEETADLVLQAIDTLPAGADFQVILWERPDLDGRPVALPGRRMRAVSTAARSDVQRGLDEAITGGTTEADAAFALAVANRAGTIVVITGKGRDLLAGWADRLLAARDADTSSVVHVLAIDPEAGGDAGELRRLAEVTGGSFRGVTVDDVRRALGERAGAAR